MALRRPARRRPPSLSQSPFQRPGASFFDADDFTESPRTQERVPRSLTEPDLLPDDSGDSFRELFPRGFRSPLLGPISESERAPYAPRRAGTRASARARAPRLFPKSALSPLYGLRIRNPFRVAFCLRRTLRRSFLFAVGIAGRRGLGRRGVRRTQNSQYSCR